MAVHLEAVHLRIGVIGLQQGQRIAIIGGFQRAEHIGSKDCPIGSQLAKQRLADIDRHAVQPGVCVLRAKALMFVIIGIGNLYLADGLRGQIAPGL